MRLTGVAPIVSAARNQVADIHPKAAVYILDSSEGKRTGWTLKSRPHGFLQLERLERIVADRRLILFRVYRDRLTGGKQARSSLERVMCDAEKGRFQLVLFFSFPCIADNLRQLIFRLNRLQRAAVQIVSAYEGIELATSNGSSSTGLIASLAEFETDLRRDRIRQGLDRAEVLGTRSGQRPGRPRVNLEVTEVCTLHERGLSEREIAAKLEVGVGTVHRTLKNTQVARDFTRSD